MFEMVSGGVDDACIQFGDESFISRIDSVEVTEERAYSAHIYILLLILTVLLTLGAIASDALILLTIAAVFGSLAWKSWHQQKPGTAYGVRLVTSSGEAQTFATADGDEFRQFLEVVTPHGRSADQLRSPVELGFADRALVA